MEKENKQEVVWSLTKDSHLLVLIAGINDKCRKAGKNEHSVEYWCEELLARGATTFSNYLDADEDRRNKASYLAEEEKLPVPNPEDAAAMVAYCAKISGLRRKFRIGGTQVQL
jgi:hypothetical protein